MKNLLSEVDILQEPDPQPFASQNLDVQFLKNFIANIVQKKKAAYSNFWSKLVS